VTKQHFISVNVTEDQLEEYTLAASMLRKTRSQMIREAITEYLSARSKAKKGYEGKNAHHRHAVYAQVINEVDLAVVDYYTPRQNFLQPGWYLAIRKEGAVRNVQGEKLDYVHYFHSDISVKPTYTEFVRAVMQYILDEQ
jgi:hypothetical protein